MVSPAAPSNLPCPLKTIKSATCELCEVNDLPCHLWETTLLRPDSQEDELINSFIEAVKLEVTDVISTDSSDGDTCKTSYINKNSWARESFYWKSSYNIVIVYIPVHSRGIKFSRANCLYLQRMCKWIPCSLRLRSSVRVAISNVITQCVVFTVIINPLTWLIYLSLCSLPTLIRSVSDEDPREL